MVIGRSFVLDFCAAIRVGAWYRAVADFPVHRWRQFCAIRPSPYMEPAAEFQFRSANCRTVSVVSDIERGLGWVCPNWTAPNLAR